MTSNTETDEKINTEKTDDNIVSTTLNVGKELKIVDLNANLTNFESTFTVKSTTKEPFKLIAVNEKALDDVSKLEYKVADQGVISGQIFSDIDIPNSFILVLVSYNDIETEVEIDITRNEIKPWSRTPKPQPPQPPQTPSENSKPKEQPQVDETLNKQDSVKPQNVPPKKINSVEKYENKPQQSKSFFTKYRIALIILLVVCLIAFCIYWFWPRAKGEKIDVGNLVDSSIPVQVTSDVGTSTNINTENIGGLDSDLLNNLENVKIPTELK